MKRFLTVIVILKMLFCNLTYGQKLEGVVGRMIGVGYQVKYVFDGDQATAQWLRFDSLSLLATDEQLIELTGHSDPAVKCYSFQALIERKSPSVFGIISEHLNDTDVLSMIVGCHGDSKTIIDFMIHKLSTRNQILTPMLHNELSCNSKLKNIKNYDEGVKWFYNIADSTMLFDDKSSKISLSRLMRRLNPKPHYYNKVKEIRDSFDRRDFIVLLSKFRRDKDKNEILKYLDSYNINNKEAAFIAVRNFPDTIFFSRLEQLHDEITSKAVNGISKYLLSYYEAIVQYKSDKALSLIRETLSKRNNIAKSHSVHIWFALDNYPNPKYADIKKGIALTRKDVKEIERNRRWIIW